MVGIFVALAIGWLLVVLFVRALTAEDAPPAGDGAEPTPTEGPVATVHTTIDEACAAMAAESSEVRSSAARAARDRDALVDSLLDRDGVGVTGIGLSKCGESPVVAVSVSSPLVDVPAFGPHGTPVVVWLAGPFYAY